MIRITDTTLCCLDEYAPTRSVLEELQYCLRRSGADALEFSPQAWETLGRPEPERGDSVRVRSIKENVMAGWNFYASRWGGSIDPLKAIAVVQVNDPREFSHLRRFQDCQRIRIVGMDDLLLRNYTAEFKTMQKLLEKRIQFCPENSMFCASALAVEWIAAGGEDIVASFAGIDGNAPLEEVVMALRIGMRHRPNLDLSVYSRLRDLLEKVTGRKVADNKSVIGSRIFFVESGIHVDAIKKNSQSYEPFDPALVGGERVLVLGKNSGKEAVAIKLKQYRKNAEDYDIPALLDAVRAAAVNQNASLQNEAFCRLAEHYRRS